jgi:hypothetical protein
MTIDHEKMNAMLGRMVTDLGAAAMGALVMMGDRLGLYHALAKHGPCTAEELAGFTGTFPRYVHEWLCAQAASQYVDYDAATGRFLMRHEQALVLAHPESPAFLAGGYYSVASLYHDEPILHDAYKSGRGVGWQEHCPCMFCGAERFFGPGYRANIVHHWLPALESVVEKLERGALVADVGCGHALSARLMAHHFPNSRFVGVDYHPPSIEHARELATNEGLTNISFEHAAAKTFSGEGYDLICSFDSLHDMGDPTGVAAYLRSRLKPDGTWMIVEPISSDVLTENFNPVGRAFYAFSAMVCVPASMSQEGQAGLGAQAGEAKYREVITAGGFSRFRRAAETPTNMVLEARP